MPPFSSYGTLGGYNERDTGRYNDEFNPVFVLRTGIANVIYLLTTHTGAFSFMRVGSERQDENKFGSASASRFVFNDSFEKGRLFGFGIPDCSEYFHSVVNHVFVCFMFCGSSSRSYYSYSTRKNNYMYKQDMGPKAILIIFLRLVYAAKKMRMQGYKKFARGETLRLIVVQQDVIPEENPRNYAEVIHLQRVDEL
ncbi:hypothetical protein TNCV_2911391 [Trichonephila clavipes]|nr:hypothetical protein TNCV_2911391 [Trichonephila clavipes]